MFSKWFGNNDNYKTIKNKRNSKKNKQKITDEQK